MREIVGTVFDCAIVGTGFQTCPKLDIWTDLQVCPYKIISIFARTKFVPTCQNSKMIKVGILTCSDKCYAGKRKDTSGKVIKQMIKHLGKKTVKVVKYEILPDEKVLIRKKLIDWVDNEGLNLIFTTGGTGIAPRDKTPEATEEVVFFEVPGIAELIRFEGYKKTPFAVLSRGICGVRRKTLIVNLPGSEKAVKESLEIILPIIPHAIELLQGHTEHK